MQKSTTVTKIMQALFKFQAEVSKIKKDSDNPFFKSKYAALPDIQDAILPALQANELVYMQFPEEDNKLTTIVTHVGTGEFFQSTMDIHPLHDYLTEKDNNKKIVWRSDIPHITPQALGSAITYAKRYALVAILGLNIDDDDDGNEGSGKKSDTAADTAKKPDLTPLSPDNKKDWQNAILLVQNKKHTTEDILRSYKISDVDKALFLKESKKAKPTLKPGTAEWMQSVKALAASEDKQKKLDAIQWRFNIAEASLQDLQLDAIDFKTNPEQYEPTNTTK